MPLVHCRACGKQISDEATACPDCGAPQSIKKKGGGGAVWLLIPILIAGIGAILYFKTNLFNNSTTIVIPEGSYVLEKSPDKGLLRFLEGLNSNVRGLGNQLTVSGDTVIQSTGALSALLASLDGGSTRFRIQKTNTDNQFILYLNNNMQVPLQLTANKELMITLNGMNLVYQKQ
jgi:hypothetical protein